LNLLKRLTDALTSSSIRPSDAYWLHVRCDQCGEALRSRVDLQHDLSARFDQEGGPTTYFCRKTLIGGSGCYRRIEVELNFDSRRKLIDREVTGGKFITAEEWEESQSE
jgi:hypothetical protein